MFILPSLPGLAADALTPSGSSGAMCAVPDRHVGHSLSKVKQTRYGTRGSWLCAWAYLPSRDVAIDEAPRAGGDECAGVGDGTSGRGPQRGVGTLAGPPGDDAERTAW